ncbi:NAD(P)/FAD-dependent oxidoreductase [Granulicella arctica]|uniref:NAD(P)/FAD-dependent oxidoreductase n=1 Tax=Granulicella arctica TaxID=940613 RepID=UPI0021DF8D27|nr:FAD-dependent oxidoreductase [Granulicella arctica]
MRRARQNLEASPDVCIAGAGIIGLALALELHRCGARVTVLDRDTALSHTSIAAAGMLAAQDPENPSQLKPLSERSVALYPQFLSSIEALSGCAVPFQTSRTFQAHPSYANAFDSAMLPALTPGSNHFQMLDERSVDPRQLAAALLAAVRNTTITIREHTALRSAVDSNRNIRLDTTTGSLDTPYLVHTQGAWSLTSVIPRKGQMLSVGLPSSLKLRDVIRTTDIYIVPRTQGPRAGHALIGATVEDVGFDTTTHDVDLVYLRNQAARLLPQLADEKLCPTVDRWAGLRPGTPDALPLLGRLTDDSNQFVAVGHYRNGILLAPATAEVLAQIIIGRESEVDLTPFSPQRFPAKDGIAQ